MCSIIFNWRTFLSLKIQISVWILSLRKVCTNHFSVSFTSEETFLEKKLSCCFGWSGLSGLITCPAASLTPSLQTLSLPPSAFCLTICYFFLEGTVNSICLLLTYLHQGSQVFTGICKLVRSPTTPILDKLSWFLCVPHTWMQVIKFGVARLKIKDNVGKGLKKMGNISRYITN